MASVVSFAGTGVGTASSGSVGLRGGRQVFASLTGTFTATLELQVSWDDGASYETLSKNEHGDAASYSGSGAAVSLNLVIAAHPAALYRWYCTAYTSGTPVGALY